MILIAAAGNNWEIGRGGGLLASVPEDMAFFKRMTMGHAVVMGRKTFESFPGKKALPGRLNIVLTRDREWKAQDTITVPDEYALRDVLAGLSSEAFLIGGGQIYRRLLPMCRKAYITHLRASFEADTWMPDLAQNGFHVSGILDQGESGGIPYMIKEWTRG